MKEIIIGYNEHKSGEAEPLWTAWEQTGELIRCKDCKYSEPACGNINCKKDGLFAVDIHPVNWFCADGSKKE